MTTELQLSRRARGGRMVARAASVAALLGIAPVLTIADPPAAPAPTAMSRVAQTSLADLDLSTSAGMSEARERLQNMARHVCAASADGGDHRSRPGFTACVNNTLADAIRQIDTRTRIHHSVTHSANVSLADLDLSTFEGVDAARQRLQKEARRLCAELGRNHSLTSEPFETCVSDALAGALAQAKAIAAAKDSRTAGSPAR